MSHADKLAALASAGQLSGLSRLGRAASIMSLWTGAGASCALHCSSAFFAPCLTLTALTACLAVVMSCPSTMQGGVRRAAGGALKTRGRRAATATATAAATAAPTPAAAARPAAATAAGGAAAQGHLFQHLRQQAGSSSSSLHASSSSRRAVVSTGQATAAHAGC